METDKKELIFQAVMQLLEEGREPHTIKVSEISERAGIGKGTIYGYFSSKESVILNTLWYELNQIVIEVERRMTGDLHQQVSNLFDYIKENDRLKKCFLQMIKLGIGSMETPKQYNSLLCDKQYSHKFLERTIAKLIEQARSEALLGNQKTEMYYFAIISTFVNYGVYLKHIEKVSLTEEGADLNIKDEELRDYLYNALLAALGV